jgi:predicted nuclease with RNAse H fold
MNKSSISVAGIDVGGMNKGFHLVILRGTQIVEVSKSTEPSQLHECCLQHGVQVIGIDAPSQWSIADGGRAAERAMARERISCFSTPTEERAKTSSFYDWMFNGLRIYAEFARTHPVLATKTYEGAKTSFETFPHAITCAIRGRENTSAKSKRVQRRELLNDLKIDTTALKSIDDIDAALCALTAQRLIEGKTHAYGDAETGYIFVPKPKERP